MRWQYFLSDIDVDYSSLLFRRSVFKQRRLSTGSSTRVTTHPLCSVSTAVLLRKGLINRKSVL